MSSHLNGHATQPDAYRVRAALLTMEIHKVRKLTRRRIAKTHIGTIRGDVRFPKSLTKFSHSAATIRAMETVSRVLKWVVNLGVSI